MESEQCISIMKALADPSRLAIVNSLLGRSQYVEELASRHGLAPSTVSFHLRKLEEAGLVTSRKEQYYTVVRAQEAVFDTTLRELVSVPPANRELQDVRMTEYREKVLGTFFSQGRLEKLPAQHKKRLIVLEHFVARFERERRYGEQEVTGVIVPLFDDYCTIRRLLVEEGLLQREGATYWREKEVATGAEVPVPAGAKKRAPSPAQERKAQLKREYLEKAPDAGIYQLRNTANGRIYIGSSTNLDGTKTSRLFQLRMGKAVFSRSLQEDLDRYGAESFEFAVLEVLPAEKAEGDTARHLAALELAWLEKLRPFGAQGYNSEKAYKRALERR